MAKPKLGKPIIYGEKKRTETEIEAEGNGWYVYKKNDQFFLSYMSGTLAGQKTSDMKISKVDCQRLKDGTITLNDLDPKYNLK